jgi:DNA invertase Pin-like site-specific DNA recombinase
VNIWGYTVLLQTDPGDIHDKLRKRVVAFSNIVAKTAQTDISIDARCVYTDGFEAIHEHITKRPAGKELFTRDLAGDYLVLIGLERIFLNQNDMLLMCNRLKKRGVNVILADLRLDLSTKAGEVVFKMLDQFRKLPSKRKKAVGKLKLV